MKSNGIIFLYQDMMNFTYTVTEPPDGQWGAIRPDGTWSGMVGMLQEKQVDFCKYQL